MPEIRQVGIAEFLNGTSEPAIRMYLYLYVNSDSNFEIEIGLEQLALQLCKSERTAKRNMHELVNSGYCLRNNNGIRCNTYKLLVRLPWLTK